MAIPVLVGISLVVFSMMHLAPGDPAEAMLGPLRTQETLEQVRRDLGLDRPYYAQYFSWVGRALRADLGRSIRLNRPVLPEVLEKFWRSLILASAAFTIAVTVGIVAGVVSATRRSGVVDNLVTVTAITGVSVPPFFLGMVLILVFSVYLGILPSSGMYDIRGEPSLGALLKHMILPALTLAAAPIAVITRMMRSSMLEVIGQDFIRTARAKGVAERAVIVRHALRNALIPVVNVFGLQVGYLLSATALVEIVFSWPGLGSLLVQSVITRDLPLAQGAIVVIAVVYVMVNIAADVVQAMLDPRIQLR
jgi:peptide/nickel transport system permease protein